METEVSLHLIETAVQEKIARLNVAAIIINEESKILFCKRSQNKKVAPGVWHMPGGKIEEGESVEEAIIRELKEELNLSVQEVLGYSGVVHDYSVGAEKHRTLFVYVVATGKVTLNLENEAVDFFPIEQLKNILLPNVLETNLTATGYGLSQKTRSHLSK